MLLAVNGTLMQGLELNGRMIKAGAWFVAEASTAPCYRLWSIEDAYPAMLRDYGSGRKVDLELWDVPQGEIAALVVVEPDGLCLGKILLDDGQSVLGILAEPYITTRGIEITEYGGWRNYLKHKTPKA